MTALGMVTNGKLKFAGVPSEAGLGNKLTGKRLQFLLVSRNDCPLMRSLQDNDVGEVKIYSFGTFYASKDSGKLV